MSKKSNNSVTIAKFNECVEDELERQLRDLPQTIDQILHSAVWSILGLRDCGRGRNTVDTWDKNNPICAYIRAKADEAVQEVVGPLLKKQLSAWVKTKTLSDSITDSTMRQLSYTFDNSFRSGLHDIFERLAKRYLKRVEEELSKELDNIGAINTDLNDPESYKGKLGRLLLEEQAKLLAEVGDDE
jgi:hypothetical protein